MKFNAMQLEVINHYKGNCCVIASAGSGKSSSVTYRVKNLIENYNVNPNKILCVTFTTKTRDDLKLKLKELLPFCHNSLNIETFHSLGYKIIKEKYNNYGFIGDGWERDKIINDIIIKKLKLDDGEQKGSSKIKRFIGIQKNKLLLPDDNLYFNNIDIPYEENIMQQIYKEYELEKERQNLLDYDDMMIKGYYVLKNNTNILEKFQNKFEFINVDEFQDTSECQINTLQLLGLQGNVLVVGDMLQSIYKFRGSDNKYILNFEEYFEDPKIINLNINYRSTSNIVNYSNSFADTLIETKNKYYKKSEYFRGYGNDIDFKIYQNENVESKSIAIKIKEILSTEQCNLDDIMIMSRTNSQLQNLEMSLYNNGIPFKGDGGSFVKRLEIKLILSYLRLAIDINDNESFEFIYNKPLRWLSKAFMQECKDCAKQKKYKSLFLAMQKIPRRDWRFSKGIDEIYKTITHLQIMNQKKRQTVKKIINKLRNILDIDIFVSKDVLNQDDNNDIIDNLDNLENIAGEYKTIEEFIEYMNKLEKSSENVICGVNLSTIHRAKGLEKKICFVIGVSESLLPHEKNEDINEEGRLYYVAITRSVDELYISSIVSYRGKELEISRFVKC